MRFLILVVLLMQTGCASLGPLSPLRHLENKMLYHPTAGRTVDSDASVQNVWIPGGDQRIHGVLVQHPQARGCLLYCHGNAGNVVDRLPRLKRLAEEHRLNVLAFDYRGYGQSEGKPVESGLYRDARAARTFLASHFSINENDVILFGRSLGGAVAVELAQDGARGLILESTFTSVSEVGQSHVKWLPVSLVVSQRFDSARKIPKYRGPLLQSHGTSDEVIPYKLGEKLHQKANEPKQFVVLQGGHNNATSPDYDLILAGFIDGLF